MRKYEANQYQYHLTFSKESDRDIIDFLKAQGKTIKSGRLIMNTIIMLFGKQDLSNVSNDIEKYGLINVLEKRIAYLKS